MKLSKELDVVTALQKATEEGKVAWRTLAEPGLWRVSRYLGSLPTGRSFLLQGPSLASSLSAFGGTVLLEIRDAEDNVAYTIQDDPLHPVPLGTALRGLYALVTKRADAILDEMLQ